MGQGNILLSSLVVLALSIGACGPSKQGFSTQAGIKTGSSEYKVPKDIPLPIELNTPPKESQSSTKTEPEKKRLEQISAAYSPLKTVAPKESYARFFHESGQPKFNYTKRLNKKFGKYLNQSRDDLSQDRLEKSKRLLAEIQKVANREIPAPKSLLIMDKDEAKRWSLSHERTGVTADRGAWSIAVGETAVRHGFPQTPCAEFVSEIIRQAYKRAGYKHESDFSIRRGNRLIWHKTASVAGLAKALVIAGWIPWDANKHRPPLGAIMMNGTGQTPGHVFISAGQAGRFIVDNGSPQGRDLATLSDQNIGMMFKAGVFFLPAGLTPEKWPEKWSDREPTQKLAGY